MTVEAQLTLNMQGYWRPGSGKGSGSHVDTLVDKDRYGCPFIPGRMVKGVLRDAVLRLLSWNSLGLEKQPSVEQVLEILFGSRGFENKRPRNDTRPGLVRVGDGMLDQATRQWLGENVIYCRALYRDLYTTAIDPQSGVARQGSLRGEQVVVPTPLVAKLTLYLPDQVHQEDCTPEEQWVYEHAIAVIEGALPLVQALGAGRTRGLGRVVVKMEVIL